MREAEPHLKVGVSKRFWRPALKNATIEISAQRSLGLIGENGAGKSTLMRISPAESARLRADRR